MKKTFLIATLTLWFYLCMCIIVKAQTAIYRSIQPGNTSTIATNAIGTLTISGSTATFSAALPDSIGIGCVIQYDVNNDGTVDNLAFIHGRTSSTVFTVKDSLGATPNAVTGDDAWSIFHAYTHHFFWEAGTENTGINLALRNFDTGNRNIDTNNEQWFVCVYRGTQITSSATAIDWVTGAPGTNKKINIFTPRSSDQVGVSQFHNGRFANGNGFKIIYTGAGGNIISVENRNTVIDGIVIHDSSAGGATTSCIRAYGAAPSAEIVIKNCIIKGHTDGVGNGNGVEVAGSGATVKISNCYVFRVLGGTGSGTKITSASHTMYAYNNTMHNCATNGISRTAGTAHIKNNICTNTGVADFSGTFSTSEYNASQDATASGTGSRINQTFNFTDAANGDLSLTCSDAGAKDFGEDLSSDANLPVTDDIIGTTRTVPVTIGAFECVCGGRRRWIVQ